MASMFTKTTNGAGAYKTTGNKLVDLFSTIGASRNNPEGIRKAFADAYKVDPLYATAILLYARDIRHDGAGERQVFRTILKDMADTGKEYTGKVVNLIPEIGRFDDLKVLYGTPYGLKAAQLWADALKKGNVLAAKWAKREDKQLQKLLGLNEAGLRKFIAGLRKEHLPETKMCEGRWDAIDYSKVPSVCGMRNAKAFKRNDEARYMEFLGSKETKVNASVSFPHDVYRMMKSGGQREAAGKYWAALPDLGVKGNILPIVDTSSSMNCMASGSVTCLDVSVSLGTYLAQRIEGKFKNMMFTFDSTPKLMQIPDYSDPCKILDWVANIPWGGSTNLQATYETLLQKAKSVGATQADMPEYLLILSDMQFNQAVGAGAYSYRNSGVQPDTIYADMRKKFAAAGYKMPKVIFWNLNASYGNQPSTCFEGDTAMIAGFSPNIIKAVLNCESVQMTPQSIMEEALAPFIEMLK